MLSTLTAPVKPSIKMKDKNVAKKVKGEKWCDPAHPSHAHIRSTYHSWRRFTLERRWNSRLRFPHDSKLSKDSVGQGNRSSHDSKLLKDSRSATNDSKLLKDSIGQWHRSLLFKTQQYWRLIVRAEIHASYKQLNSCWNIWIAYLSHKNRAKSIAHAAEEFGMVLLI